MPRAAFAEASCQVCGGAKRRAELVLSAVEVDVIESLHQHDVVASDVNRTFRGTQTIGDCISDHVASLGGSWKFIIGSGPELEIRNPATKVDLLISHQWQHLLEIQQIQTDMMNELLVAIPRTT